MLVASAWSLARSQANIGYWGVEGDIPEVDDNCREQSAVDVTGGGCSSAW